VLIVHKARSGLLTGVFLLGMLLTACAGQQNTAVVCNLGTLQAAANLSPQNVVVDASKPVTLSWTYSDPNCQPTYYEVVLGVAHDGSVPGTTQSSQSSALNWPETLQPGNTYFWTVYPVVVTNGQATRGPGQLGYFYTGPACAAGASLLAPQPVSPPDGTPFDPSVGIILRWDDPTTCLPDGPYNVQIAKSEDFSAVLYASQTGHITELSLSAGWANEAVQNCTRYYWRVQAGPSGPWSGAWSFILNKAGGACPLLEASATPIPIPTATPTSIPQTPMTAPAWLQANVNVNCRRGPSAEYENLDTLFRNWSARIYGRNPESTWWYIHRPNQEDFCWVWGGAVTLTGDTSQVPVVVPPPPPTASPLPPTSTPSQ
jgi:hypothetical protein